MSRIIGQRPRGDRTSEQSRIEELQVDAAYMDPANPRHEAVVNEMLRLNEKIHGTEPITGHYEAGERPRDPEPAKCDPQPAPRAPHPAQRPSAQAAAPPQKGTERGVADADPWIETGRLRLADEAFNRIVAAPGLPSPSPEKLAWLRREVEERGAEWRIATALAAGPRRSRTHHARQLRAVGSDADRLAQKLDEWTLAGLGLLLDKERGRDEYSDEPSGFELLSRHADGVRLIARLAQQSARSVDARKDTSGRGQRGRFGNGPSERSRSQRLGPFIAGSLAWSFESAFGRKAGAARSGPGARFVLAFFEAFGAHVSARTTERWLREALKASEAREAQ